MNLKIEKRKERICLARAMANGIGDADEGLASSVHLACVSCQREDPLFYIPADTQTRM